MAIYLLTTVHVLICVFLIAVVLLQSGKAADLAGAFGGMGSQTVFGPRGSATVLSKATTIAATLFMVTSLTLSIIATKGGSSTILDRAAKPSPTQNKQAAPAQPAKSAPITVTPQVEGSAPGAPRTINAPIQTVPEGQSPTMPPRPGAPAPNQTPSKTK